jgi:nucleotide-binding universal stress UspA family protein
MAASIDRKSPLLHCARDGTVIAYQSLAPCIRRASLFGEPLVKAQLILVPIDFTPSSSAALEAAATLVRSSGGRLLIVHVLEHQGLSENLVYSIIHRLLRGDPVDGILGIAESEHVDLIVLGTHGRRGIDRVLMGSIAEAVVRRAKCPVLAVKTDEPPTVLAS